MELKVTPKQLEILTLLYRFRFLNRHHIQQLLHHKDTKTINTWLKDLTDKKIIGRHYSARLKENTKPAIYFLVAKSRYILIKQPSVDEKLIKQRIYREKSRSQKFIAHHLAMADFYLDLLTTLKNDKLHFFTKTDLSRHYYLPYSRPDAFIARENKKETKRYFLEIIDEGTPRFMIRAKVAQYIEYAQSNKWQEQTRHSFPALLFVCPNQTIKDFMHKHILQALEEESFELDCYTTTIDQIRSGSNNSIWKAVEDVEED
jgi:hypothetical protein